MTVRLHLSELESELVAIILHADCAGGILEELNNSFDECNRADLTKLMAKVYRFAPYLKDV